MLRLPFSRTVNKFVDELVLRRELARENWFFSDDRVNMILNEGFDWYKYLPVSVKGKVVLDVGAGEGETARLFLLAGAKQVVCVECDEQRLKKLYGNAKFHREIVVVPSVFELAMLDYPFDFMKMDIEGYEECLLGVDVVKPSVLEIHGQQLTDKFEVFGWRVVGHVGCGWWTCYGYKNC